MRMIDLGSVFRPVDGKFVVIVMHRNNLTSNGLPMEQLM